MENKPYYLGLDCGTNSVGFAVTDKNYKLLKAGKKDIWGSHLFDEAKTAESRRIQRNTRKRLQRRKERIKILQSLFAEEIYKIDPTFFIRLNESSLLEEDRSNTNKQAFSLFNDKDFTDIDYKKAYPTIYHLRLSAYNGEIKDPRLLYLAIHHIMKHRGHFLFPGENLSCIQTIKEPLEDLCSIYSSIFEDEELGFTSVEDIEKDLRLTSKKDRIEELKKHFYSSNDKRKNSIIAILVGYSRSLSSIFDNEEYKEYKVEFNNENFEEKLAELEEVLEEDELAFIEQMKAIYDWALIANIMAGHITISEAKVAQHEQNKKDINLLKDVFRDYYRKDEAKKGERIYKDDYYNFFYGEQQKKNNKVTFASFASYIGTIYTNKKSIVGSESKSKKIKKTKTEDFTKTIKERLEKIKDDERANKIIEKIENDSFFPLLRSFRNGVIPFQLNKTELEVILEKAASSMPWLEEKDEEGLSVKEKILQTFKFRIPYYCGPLVDPKYNKNAWLVRLESGQIRPWNFERKVNIKKSAEAFIERMTNKCTYLPLEDVIPKQSLLYQEYLVLNEINNLKINDEPISVEQKKIIFEEFKKENVTVSKIKKLAECNCWVRKGENVKISGVDTETNIKSNLSSYIKFKDYIESGKLTRNEVEDIIRWHTIFSDGGDFVKEKLRENLKDKLSEKDIEIISKMKFSGWGNFSKKFLTEIEGKVPETGEYTNIIGILKETNLNLMEIINDPEIGIVDELTPKETISKLTYDTIDEMRLSPKVKRQLWQAIKIVKEIEKVMGYKPERVFIEVAREKGEKGKRTKSRKEQLLEKLKNIETNDEEIIKAKDETIERVKAEDESLITKRDKLYLYYSQLGKSMYSGKSVNLSDLLNGSQSYDIDHIYPYSKSDDDSLDNKVICLREENAQKSDQYPLSPEIQMKMKSYWTILKNAGLISSSKYQKLTRNTPLTASDTNSFIARQLVETRQSTKALANILRCYFGDETQIIYSKAGKVSDFRDEFKIYKARSINELHHAQDAYLNIVVGNTLHTKYTQNYFRKEPNFKKPFEKDVLGAWDKEETIKVVRKELKKRTILFTRQPEMRTGKLFDLNLLKKGEKEGMIPSKLPLSLKKEIENNPEKRAELYKKWTNKYGGYNSLAISHFTLIKRKDKKNKVYTFVRIPIIRAEELSNKANIISYCEKELGYKEVEVVREKVLFNTLLSVDGFLMTVTGTANLGAKLSLESVVPLFLSNEDTFYVKKIEKFLEKKKTNKNLLVDERFDEINREKNEKLYDLLLEKAKLPIYQNRPASCVDTIKNGKEMFNSLKMEEQLFVLQNILTYLGMTNGISNFKLINGGPTQGTLTIQSTVSTLKKEICIIDQSITGIYEEKFKLE